MLCPDKKKGVVIINNYSLKHFKFEQDTDVWGEDGLISTLAHLAFTQKPGFGPKLGQDKLHSFTVKPSSFPRLDSTTASMQSLLSLIPVMVELTKD